MSSIATDPTRSPFLTVAQAADELAVTERFIRKLIAAGDLSDPPTASNAGPHMQCHRPPTGRSVGDSEVARTRTLASRPTSPSRHASLSTRTQRVRSHADRNRVESSSYSCHTVCRYGVGYVGYMTTGVTP